MKGLGVAVNTEVGDTELLPEAGRAAAGKAGWHSTPCGVRPSPGPSQAPRLAYISSQWEEKDAGLSVQTMPLGSGSFIPLSLMHSFTHSFIQQALPLSLFQPGFCWVFGYRHEGCPLLCVPHHNTFWMAAKKLRAKYNFFYWRNYINPGFSYNQQSLFSLWAWSLIFLNGPIVSLSYFVSHSRAFLEVSWVQIRNQ